MANYGPREVYPGWTSDEVARLREAFPASSWSELERLFPERTKAAIQQFARRALGLKRSVNKRDKWSFEEIAALKRLYAVADEDEIEAAVGRPFSSCQKKANELFLRRPAPGTRKNKRFVHPVIQQLRAIRLRKKLSRRALAKIMGYHENNMLGWELGKTQPQFNYVTDLAEALGYDLVLRERFTSQSIVSTVIAWPDKKKLMGGR